MSKTDKKHIVVTLNGFVFLGNISRQPKEIIITNCFNIRKWGTTKGLGEIALNGPTKSTVLDEYGTVIVPIKSVIYTIDCLY